MEEKQSTKRQDLRINEQFVKSQQLEDFEEIEEQKGWTQKIGEGRIKEEGKSKQTQQKPQQIHIDANIPSPNKESLHDSPIPYLQPQIANHILSCVIIIRKKAQSHHSNINQVYQILAKQHKNKTFTLDIILNPNLSNHSILKLLILQILFQKFLKQQQNAKSYLNHLQTQLSHSDIILQKSIIKKQLSFKIYFFQLYLQNLKQIYDESNLQIRKQFNSKIHYILSAVTDLVISYQDQIPKLKQKLNLEQVLDIYEKNPNEKSDLIKKLKEKVGQSVDRDYLIALRVQMEKIMIYKKFKKIKFNNDSRLKMLDHYNDHCKSSSQSIIKKSFQNNTGDKQHLRKEIMKIQCQSIKTWLDMYGAVFSLANDLSNLQSTYINSNDLENGNKEPIEILEDYFEIDLAARNQNQKNTIFEFCLSFFSKLQKDKLNYKVFHQKIISIVEKLAEIVIKLSFHCVHLWTAKEDKFKTIKHTYKRFRYLGFLKENIEFSECFCNIWQIFHCDETFEEILQNGQTQLYDDPDFTQQLFIQKLPQMIKFYTKIGFTLRVQQVKTISMRIACYFKTLKQIGFSIFFNDKYKNSLLRKKYEGSQKPTFNKIHELVSIHQKAKFPQTSQYIKTLLYLYKEAEIVENHFQKYLSKSNLFLEKSAEIKKQFMKTKSIDKKCYDYKGNWIKEETFSFEELQKIIYILTNNSTSRFVSWDFEKMIIENQKSQFIELTGQIQIILLESEAPMSIKQLNLMFFDVLSYPFTYENLQIFYLYIRQRVQRTNKLSIQQLSNTKSKRQKADSIEMIYTSILNSLELKEKTNFQARLSKEQILAKINSVEHSHEMSQIIANPIFSEMRQKILNHLEIFEEIKNDCQFIVQRINRNQLLQVKEIISLSQKLSRYKQQNVFELGLEVMYSQVEIYKLSFSDIPNSTLDMQVLLQQLKSLKDSFKTRDVQKRIKEIQVRISNQ